jgi:hypothetical protein
VKVGERYRKGGGKTVWSVKYLDRDTWGGASFAYLVAASGKTRKVYTTQTQGWNLTPDSEATP